MPDIGEALATTLEFALDTLRQKPPSDLERALRFIAGLDSTFIPKDPLSVLVNRLRNCGPNDRVLHALTLAIQGWDHQADATWSKALPHTEERRQEILGRLGFNAAQQFELNKVVLRFSSADLAIVIAKKHIPWYLERKRSGAIRDFYWTHYRAQLCPPKGNWSSNATSGLDASIDDVISRLSDPMSSEIYPVKGLVMGYVQSGKTSHFSGLITKASDAGYRLIIVLAGTLEILRRQTQRRIDKEIVGKELLGTEEYGSDSDWVSFVTHGGRPSEIGSFDWERLTNRDDDYQNLSRHLTLLDFKRSDRAKPLNHPDNLRSMTAKLAVIKKIPSRVNKLCANLEKLGKEVRTALEHVPTLVIDDEIGPSIDQYR